MKDSLGMRDAHVLIVDDDTAFAETVADGLTARGWRALAIGDAVAAVKLLREPHFDALVADLRMPEVDGLKLLALAKQLTPERPVIIMTAFSAIDSAVECVRQGAYHYLAETKARQKGGRGALLELGGAGSARLQLAGQRAPARARGRQSCFAGERPRDRAGRSAHRRLLDAQFRRL